MTQKSDPIDLHQQLVLRAEKWLKTQGCGFVIRDPFRCSNTEQPDAIGWRSGVSILIEVKVSRADFLADKKKVFRRHPEQGMGVWRFYLAPDGMLTAEHMPNGWGLLGATKKTINHVHNIPPNTCWFTKAPFVPNLKAEQVMMISALRTMELRGHLSDIYEGI